MITMIDEMFDRDYRGGREQLNSTILGLATSFGNAVTNAFKVLNRIEYSAPWLGKSKSARIR